MNHEIKDTTIFGSSAQMWIIPMNSLVTTTSRFDDRLDSLYPKNVELCRRLSTNGELKVGQCVLYHHEAYQVGLMSAKPDTAPKYIANLVYMNHPAYPKKITWLQAAIDNLVKQLTEIAEDEGIKKVAIYAKPLTLCYEIEDIHPQDYWENQVLPYILQAISVVKTIQVDIHI